MMVFIMLIHIMMVVKMIPVLLLWVAVYNLAYINMGNTYKMTHTYSRNHMIFYCSNWEYVWMELFGMTSCKRAVEKFIDINASYEIGPCYEGYML